MVKTKITPAESDAAQLATLEDVIATAQRWAVEEARSLLQIQQKRLWRVQGYESFEQYGQHRWGYEHSQLYRLCRWAETLANVSPIGENGPTRESHARPLFALSADQQREVWRAVMRRTSNPTAVVVTEIVGAFLDIKTKPVPVVRKTVGTVVCGDAVKMLTMLANNSVDLILFSPPYAMQRAKEYPSIPERDYPLWMVKVFGAARQKMKPSSSIMFVAREHIKGGVISDYLLRTRLALRDAGWHEIDQLIWSKPNSPPTTPNDRPRRAYECVYWFSRVRKPYTDVRACGQPPVSDRQRSIRTKHGLQGKTYFGRVRIDQPCRVTDVITVGVGGPEGIDHPAIYPAQLCDQLIRTYSPVGGLVVDPFCGSGTTLVAAKNAGRSWWGCDVVQRYVAIARQQLLKA